jgi:hypothetical protein
MSAPEPPIEISIGLPERLTHPAAAGLLAAELERALKVYRRNEAAGVDTANFAVFRFCYALGRPDLAEPFRALCEALRDLKEGKPVPPLLQPGPPANGNHKSRAEWGVICTACAYLDVLIRATKMQRDPAAKAVAAILDKRRITVGQDRTPTWKAIKNAREHLRQGICPELVAKSFKDETEGLEETLSGLPYQVRRKALLDALRGTSFPALEPDLCTASGSEKNRNWHPSSCDSDSA